MGLFVGMVYVLQPVVLAYIIVAIASCVKGLSNVMTKVSRKSANFRQRLHGPCGFHTDRIGHLVPNWLLMKVILYGTVPFQFLTGPCKQSGSVPHWIRFQTDMSISDPV